MLKIHPAKPKDNPAILKILKKLDLFYPSHTLNDFWIAEQEKSIAGIVKFEDLGGFCFLSSLAVVEEQRNKGIAAALIKKLIRSASKDIYLYTIIPDFFKRFGFISIAAPSFLPSRKPLECEYCQPKKCVCMVKYAHVA